MKRLMGFVFGAVAAFSLIQTFSLQLRAQERWSRDNPPRNGVCFFTDADYRGDSFCADANESQPHIGNFNDRISSIRVYGRAEVTVYADSNFNGSHQTYTQDQAHLGNWGDRISSFQVMSTRASSGPFGGIFGNRDRDDEPAEGACFYRDENYRGDRFCVNSNESRRNLPNRFSDRIGSIRIFGRAEVTIYEDSDFSGSRQTLSQDRPNLRNWDGRIRSFEVTPARGEGRQPGRRYRDRADGRGFRNGACFYTDDGYNGDSFCMKAGETRSKLEGRFNDRISSIEIFGRARVTVYENNNFGGARRSYDRSVTNLAGDFNDTISSIEVR